MKIYLACRKPLTPPQELLARLHNAGHEVYDFKHPVGRPFDPTWRTWAGVAVGNPELGVLGFKLPKRKETRGYRREPLKSTASAPYALPQGVSEARIQQIAARIAAAWKAEARAEELAAFIRAMGEEP